MKLIQPVHFQPFLILLFLYFGKNGDIHLDFPKWFAEWFYHHFLHICVCFSQSFWQFLLGSFLSLLKAFYMDAFFSFRLKWPNWSQHSISHWSCWCTSLVSFGCSFYIIWVFSLARSCSCSSWALYGLFFKTVFHMHLFGLGKMHIIDIKILCLLNR